MKDFVADAKDRMIHAVEATVRDFQTIRTGRANPAMLDRIEVDAYGTPMPINQLANISVPEPRQILISPYDRSTTQAIERAIQKSDLGINPIVDGNGIRLTIPQMTEDRRKELVKVAHKYAEAARVAFRHVRRDGMEILKKLDKDHKVSQDEHKRHDTDVQKATDATIAEIDKMLATKEKEILTV